MWNTLIAAIKTVVESSNEIHQVYDHRQSTFEKYPVAVVCASDIAAPSFADTSRNQRTYVISVRIYQERSEQGEDAAERIIRTIADDLISKFDADYYLGATLAGRGFIRPIPGRFLEPPNNGEGADVIGMEILVEAVVIQ